MDASSRVPAPPPLDIGPVRAATNPVKGTPKSPESAKSGTFSGGDCYASPTSISTSSPLLWGRKDSSSPGAQAAKRPPLVPPRKVNAHSYCGRHSDEFLFGGKGLGDLWRAVTKK
ncbi:uncharacterized protein B0T15DRAFT_298740 [Chaetomium strumarium]|uniref:Uncharacterized protein n=1 Tax=Chaetomium strumarium TaxID=1170767 RepID=A0AAJ0GLT2_9PEZI|nr:hypothetical protein B0T15DRAFT_298740 [Chaetomium strumarium]